MIIEFFGLPASGKSMVADFLQREYLCDTSKERPLDKKNIILGIIYFPHFFLILTFFVIFDGGINGVWYRLKHFVLSRLGELYRAKKKSKKKCQILDEGLLQSLLSVLNDVTTKMNVIDFFVKNNPADIIVVFSPDEKLRNKHLRRRNYVLRPYLTDSERVKWETDMILNFNFFKKSIKFFDKVYVISSVDDIIPFLESKIKNV